MPGRAHSSNPATSSVEEVTSDGPRAATEGPEFSGLRSGVLYAEYARERRPDRPMRSSFHQRRRRVPRVCQKPITPCSQLRGSSKKGKPRASLLVRTMLEADASPPPHRPDVNDGDAILPSHLGVRQSISALSNNGDDERRWPGSHGRIDHRRDIHDENQSVVDTARPASETSRQCPHRCSGGPASPMSSRRTNRVRPVQGARDAFTGNDRRRAHRDIRVCSHPNHEGLRRRTSISPI